MKNGKNNELQKKSWNLEIAEYELILDKSLTSPKTLFLPKVLVIVEATILAVVKMKSKGKVDSHKKKKKKKRAQQEQPEQPSAEKLRTEELAAAFDDLKSRLPIHPRDSKAHKMNRLAILRRTCKYITFLGDLIEYVDSVENRSVTSVP